MSDFPNRPDHPDFWRLSELIIELDGEAEKDLGAFMEILESVPVDPDSLAYMAFQRALRAEFFYPGRGMLTALWMDGFLLGTRYSK